MVYIILLAPHVRALLLRRDGRFGPPGRKYHSATICASLSLLIQLVPRELVLLMGLLLAMRELQVPLPCHSV